MAAVRAGVTAILLVLTVSAVARAAGPTIVVAGVRVASPACPIAPLSVTDFVDVLRVELAGRDTSLGETLIKLDVEPCDPSTTRVQVTVADTGSERASAREIDLADVAMTARPRALALAVAELVRSAQAPVPAPPSAPPPAVGAAGPAPPLGEPLLRVVAGDALYAAHPDRDTSLWGARLSVSAERGRWHAGGFGDFLAGSHGYDAGHVTVQSLGGGLFAGPRWLTGPLIVSPAIVAAVGWVHIDGSPGGPGVVGHSGDGVAAALRARLLFSWTLGRSLMLRALVEGGWAVKPFDAYVDGARAAGLSGPSLVAGLGLAGFGP
jgi:hypothetical protein